MNKLTTFYIVRHGETEWNVLKKVQGHSDSPLTKKGLEQATNLAKEFKNIKFDLAFSSDLLRAKRTAEIIALEHKLAVQTSELIRERLFGKYEGKEKEALNTYFRLLEKMDKNERLHYAHEDIESDQQMITRLINFIRETAIAYSGKSILTVAHGGVLRILLEHTGFIKYTQPTLISNTAYVKLETDGTDIFIEETKGIEVIEKWLD